MMGHNDVEVIVRRPCPGAGQVAPPIALVPGPVRAVGNGVAPVHAHLIAGRDDGDKTGDVVVRGVNPLLEGSAALFVTPLPCRRELGITSDCTGCAHQSESGGLHEKKHIFYL